MVVSSMLFLTTYLLTTWVDSKNDPYREVTYFPTYLPTFDTYLLQKLVTKLKSNINSVEVYPQLS
jgi:hypothetical protein